MALPIYALTSLPELKDELHISEAADTDLDPRLARTIGRASLICEEFCQRKLVYRQTPYVEFHTIKEPRSILYLLDKPVVQIVEVREDAVLNFDNAAILVKNSDYQISMLDGRLVRTSGSVPIDWFFVGFRTVRVTYIAGYEPIATAEGGTGGTGVCPAIPETLRHIAVALAARMWREIDRKQQGVQSISTGAAGSMTRFSQAYLENWMKDELQDYVFECMYPTGERDS